MASWSPTWRVAHSSLSWLEWDFLFALEKGAMPGGYDLSAVPTGVNTDPSKGGLGGTPCGCVYFTSSATNVCVSSVGRSSTKRDSRFLALKLRPKSGPCNFCSA